MPLDVAERKVKVSHGLYGWPLTHSWKYTHTKGAPESLTQTHSNTKNTQNNGKIEATYTSRRIRAQTHTPPIYTHTLNLCNWEEIGAIFIRKSLNLHPNYTIGS